VADKNRAGTRFAKGQSGNPAGRPKGATNKATREIKAIAQGLLENPKYREALGKRLIAGTEASAVVVTLYHYAYGRPVELVAPVTPAGESLFGDIEPGKLASLAEQAVRVLKRAGRDA